MKLVHNHKVIGELKTLQDKSVVFIKHVNRDKHFMRVVGGYGIQEEVFNEHLRGKNGIIKIIEDKKSAYEIPIWRWENNSKTADYGFGRQVFLSTKYMDEA